MARQIGFPLLFKAVGGGGGRGMRRVDKPEDLPRMFEQARAEAHAAFGNPHLYMEKYIARPHHVEVQILGDGKGRVIHLFERECSLQRKHQKLLEEAPAPILPEKTREAIHAAALRLARALEYTNAGTVEFLYDPEENKFYFLEVNTRIQVEHPVTEMITGVDIVKEQIRVAAGERLSVSQRRIRAVGHAIECRINAEDPTRGFAPAPGQVHFVLLPQGPGVRVDTFLYPGCSIPGQYDSLVAKLIVHAPSREQAIARMRRALDEFLIAGIPTLIPFHRKIMEHPDFLEGRITTRFLEDYRETIRFEEEEETVGALLAATLEHRTRERGGLLQVRQEAWNPWAFVGRQEVLGE